jgi:hypothetical protein
MFTLWLILNLKLQLKFYRFHLQRSSSPENIGNYQSMLHNYPEGQRSHLQNCRSWNHELLLLLSYSRPGIYSATWKSRGLVCSRTRRGMNSQNCPTLGKLYWNGWLAMLLYLRYMLLRMSYWARQNNTCCMGNYLVPQNEYCYRWGVAHTEVIKTMFNCIYS